MTDKLNTTLRDIYLSQMDTPYSYGVNSIEFKEATNEELAATILLNHKVFKMNVESALEGIDRDKEELNKLRKGIKGLKYLLEYMGKLP